MSTLSDPLRLPCGLELPNRVIKAAMTEGLAEPGNDPGARLERLYRAWAEGRPGLILTGNVMVDRRSLERARNVVVDSETDAEALRRWAASTGSVPAIVQLSHPGRQVTRLINPNPVAPSALGAVGIAGAFAAPRELDSDEIAEIRDRFVDAGRRCVEAGFDGVQLHAAHGYLISAFLSPQQNTRTRPLGRRPSGPRPPFGRDRGQEPRRTGGGGGDRGQVERLRRRLRRR